jgi:hypothetical protein
MMKAARNLLLASTAMGLLLTGPVQAANSDETIKALQVQMQALQKQLNELQAQQQAQAKVQAEAAAKPAAPTDGKKEILPGVKVTVGGFIAADSIYRSKNEGNDLPSNFNTAIPFQNSANAHQGEFRGTARATRLTLLTEGDVDKDMKLSAYIESDFLGAGTTSTSTATNSFVPRLRQAFAQIDRNDWGMHFSVGQSFSLVTMNKKGLSPRAEALPNVSDGTYIPGFNYAREPQVRVTKDLFDKQVALGLSLESPQAQLGGITAPTAVYCSTGGTCTVNVTNTGTSGSSLGTNAFSNDLAPDIIGKIAFDPGWGHYEMFGIARFFHNNISPDFHNNVAVGKGVGGSVLLPVIKDKLDLRGTTMFGQGIGRYGAAGLPDFAFTNSGSIHPLTEYTMLLGAIAKPIPTWEAYLYGGMEKVMRFSENGPAATTTANAYGYGSYALPNTDANCVQAGGTCPAQTSNVWQITPGVWKELYSGAYGNMKVGAQYSLTRRNAFSDASGLAPHAYENMVFTSFRYSPF